MQNTLSSSRTCRLANLPEDILILILDHLEPRDILFLLHNGTVSADVLTTRHLSGEDIQGNRLLHIVSGLERKDYTDSIVLRSPDLSIKRRDTGGPLHIAVMSGFEATVRLLIDAGADLSLTGNWYYCATPLIVACQRGHEAIIRLLLSKGADISQRYFDEEQAIHVAADRGDPSVVQLLIDHGADINAMALLGSPLHVAARQGRPEAAEVLIKNGADPSAGHPTSFETPLDYAVGCGHLSVVELLLSAGAPTDTTTRDEYPVSVLHLAAGGGYAHIAEAYDSISDLDMVNCRAVSKQGEDQSVYDEILEILLRAGIDASQRMHSTVTALHLASFWGREKSVRLLLDAGVDTSLEVRYKRTALTIARENRHSEVCRLLEEAMA